jgi:hypothetical protein
MLFDRRSRAEGDSVDGSVGPFVRLDELWIGFDRVFGLQLGDHPPHLLDAVVDHTMKQLALVIIVAGARIIDDLQECLA